MPPKAKQSIKMLRSITTKPVCTYTSSVVTVTAIRHIVDSVGANAGFVIFFVNFSFYKKITNNGAFGAGDEYLSV
jgi:hypothetical protein